MFVGVLPCRFVGRGTLSMAMRFFCMGLGRLVGGVCVCVGGAGYEGPWPGDLDSPGSFRKDVTKTDRGGYVP